MARGLNGPLIMAFRRHDACDTISGPAFIGNTPTHARPGESVEPDVVPTGEAVHAYHLHGHRGLNDAGGPRERAGGLNGMIGLYKVIT